MLLKSAFIVGATFCLVQFVCTSPVVTRSKRQVGNSSDEDLTEDETALGQLVYFIVLSTLLSCETVTSAANTHCDSSMLPANLESDKRNHVVANSLRELLEDLRTMEPTETVYRRIFDLALKPRENATIDMWFEALDKAIAEVPVLSQRYKELKSKYEKLVVLEPDHLGKEKLLSVEEHRNAIYKVKPAQEFLVNMVFLAGLSEDKDETDKDIMAKKLKFRALAKTILEMSKSVEKYEKLQPIYKNIISEITTTVMDDKHDFDTKEVASLLYRKLRNKINADPLLGAEFKEKKTEMLKKLKKKA